MLANVTPKTWRTYAQLAAAITALQLTYWTANHVLNQYPAIPIQDQIRDWDVAFLSSPTIDAAQSAEYTEMTFPVEVEPESGPAYIAFRAQIVVDDPLASDLGLGTAFGVDNAHIFINGFPVHDPGRLAFPATSHARQRIILRVSRGLLSSGTNEIIAITTTNAARPVFASIAILGDYKELMSATAKRRFFVNEYKLFGAISSSLIAVFLLSTSLNGKFRPALSVLVILSISVAVRNAWPFFYGSYVTEPIRFSIILISACMIPYSIFLYVYLARYEEKFLIAKFVSSIFLLGVLTIFSGLMLDADRWYETAEGLTDALMALCTLAATALLIADIVRSRQINVWETATLVLVCTLLFWDIGTQIFADRDANHMRVAAPVLLIGIVAGLFARNFRLFETLGAFNEVLRVELERRTKTIEDNAQVVADAQQERQLAEERSRILRDMHDGIGGHLTSMIVKARGGRLNAADTLSGLEMAMNDLRLVVDSLDPEVSSPTEFFDVLKLRLQNNLGPASIQLSWDFRDEQLLEINPSGFLQISRILQECATNAMKHSNGSVLSVSGFFDEDAEQYRIKIRDNGVGEEDRQLAGTHGLKNISKRARALGGKADIGRCAGTGFLVEIEFPIDFSKS